MQNKLAGLIGVAALAALGSTPAASAPLSEGLLQASSFAELLQPIPDAAALLAAAEGLGAGGVDGREMMAYYHHHHHYGWGRHRYHHHHHHHHHYYRY